MKTTPQNQLLLDKIHRTCCEINNDTDMCAFYWLSGHVGQVHVRICRSKTSFIEPLFSRDVYYAERDWLTENDITDNLESTLNAIQSTVRTFQMPTRTVAA
ncbi:hypothetical protein CLV58_12524 [Spirosoma oryzae]|uniref:Uncharacterized protein n=1 Tax=Spirosoma oryzae TaxID=1469603 RepID=A0A2T0S8N2_9BACT|nr:hypothetical protein [Spirosoma oryzae]PRY29762.1 hypothetical protein CLV58_12524 [Spirosoma oryzae]